MGTVNCVFFCFSFQGLNSVACMTSAATSVDDEALQNYDSVLPSAERWCSSRAGNDGLVQMVRQGEGVAARADRCRCRSRVQAV